MNIHLRGAVRIYTMETAEDAYFLFEGRSPAGNIVDVRLIDPDTNQVLSEEFSDIKKLTQGAHTKLIRTCSHYKVIDNDIEYDAEVDTDTNDRIIFYTVIHTDAEKRATEEKSYEVLNSILQVANLTLTKH